jgi:hypothetical protein
MDDTSQPRTERLRAAALAFATMLQGIATLSATNRITDSQVRDLVSYAVELFDRGAQDTGRR